METVRVGRPLVVGFFALSLVAGSLQLYFSELFVLNPKSVQI